MMDKLTQSSGILFLDFEVTRYEWLVVIINPYEESTVVIHNSVDELKAYYDSHVNWIWCGYNIRHYDQYVFKAILCGFDAWDINDYIINKGQEGWAFSTHLREVPLIIYDVMPNPPVGLKTLEGFMGSDIRETETDFNIDRVMTEREYRGMVRYCIHDVEQTMEVFQRRLSDFEAMMKIVNLFNLPIECIGYTEARITAKVLGCVREKHDDEFQYFFLPCLRIKKYHAVIDWFDRIRKVEPTTNYQLRQFYKQTFTMDVAGIPHTFGFGGIHGASDHPVHYSYRDGAIYHVDVNNYYPSMLIAHNLVTRSARNNNYTHTYNVRKELKMKQIAAQESGDKALAKAIKKEQTPYKKMLNALSGAMKDSSNPAYDPRNNNVMCINGQLMLLDLIEHLEVIPGFVLIQSNTDGLIIQIPDTDEAFDMMDDICYEWEQRCSTELCDIGLETDGGIKEIWQKDVNNYLWVEFDGGTEAKGAYVKELNDLDNDLPIVNKAITDYLLHDVPVDVTVNSSDTLRDFQKIVKLSSKYEYVKHEDGGIEWVRRTARSKPYRVYTHSTFYTYKSYRVFASTDNNDGRILKCRSGSNPAKFANTPDHCFIYNDSVMDKSIPAKLDREYYIALAKKRLREFGVSI